MMEEGREAGRGSPASPMVPRGDPLPRVGWVKRVQPRIEQRECHRANPDEIRLSPRGTPFAVDVRVNRCVLWGRQRRPPPEPSPLAPSPDPPFPPHRTLTPRPP